jgi:hypothetical protein
MTNRIERIVTMGEHYVLATLTYLGVALLLMGTTIHGDTQALAQSGGGCTHQVWQEDHWVSVPGCESGQICCGGACIDPATQQCCVGSAIPKDEICCGDGTHGDSETCGCCDTCTEVCPGVTTLVCPD